MGLNSAIAVGDTPVTDEDLATLGLHPTGDTVSVEAVALTPADNRACVVRLPSHTLGVDGGDALVDVLDAGAFPLPGTWHVGASVSTVGYADYVVFRDGAVVRRVTDEEGDLSEEVAAIGDETPFLVDGELDGDQLLDALPRIAGALGAGSDVFTLEGEAWAAARDEGEASPPPAKKKGFFGRLLG